MKISTRGRYGLKAMADIANGYLEEKYVALRSISQKSGISENYLEHIVAQLKKSGLIKSVRGAGGGYLLSRPPEEITIGDILRALEGSLAPADCMNNSDISCGNSDCSACAAKPVLDKLFNSVNEVVDSITLKELLHKN